MLSSVLIIVFSFEIVTTVPRGQGACSQPSVPELPFSPVGVTRVNSVAAVGPYLPSLPPLVLSVSHRRSTAALLFAPLWNQVCPSFPDTRQGT